jgi:DEAD/DEAH box helicase domain-containing protein
MPFRTFTDPDIANQQNNLITLCPSCHKRVEQNVRIRSGLAGVAYLLTSISPLFLMCDYRDIGYFSEPESDLCEKQPVIAIYDQFPGGIGLSANLFDKLDIILQQCLQVLNDCPCSQGCPSCVGPAGENGIGGKETAKQILENLTK